MKRVLIYTFVGLVAFSAVGAGTIFSLNFKNGSSTSQTSKPSQPTEEPYVETNQDKFMANIMAQNLKIESLSATVKTSAQDQINVNFAGAFNYNGIDIAGGKFETLAASGDLNLVYNEINETINFILKNSNLYVTYKDNDFKVNINSLSSIFDLIPLFASEQVNPELEPVISQMKVQKAFDINSLTSMLENIKETETETGFDYSLDIPDIGTVILESDKNNTLSGIRTPAPLNIEGNEISVAGKVKASKEESWVTSPEENKYTSVDSLGYVVNSLTNVLKSKELTAGFNVKVKSNTASPIDIDLNGKLAADIKNVDGDFQDGKYELSILPGGKIQGKDNLNSVAIHYENKDLYFKVNELIKGKLTNQTLTDIVDIVNKELGAGKEGKDASKALTDLIGGSLLEEIINGNYDNIKNALVDFTSDGSTTKVIISKNFINTTEDFEIILNTADEKLSSLKVRNLKLNDIEIEFEMSLEDKFNSLPVFLNLDQFKDYEAGIGIYNTISKIMDSKQILTDYTIKVLDLDNKEFLINGELGADLTNVNFNDTATLNNGIYKLSASTTIDNHTKNIAANLEDNTLFVNYRDVLKASIKESTITDLVDYMNQKTAKATSEKVNLTEILNSFNIDLEVINEIMDGINNYDFTKLDGRVIIDENNMDKSLINIKIIPNNNGSYINLDISADTNEVKNIQLSNLNYKDYAIALNLNFKEFSDLKLTNKAEFIPMDNLVSNAAKLADSTRFNVGLHANITDTTAGVEPINLMGNVQFDLATSDYYGNLDLSLKTPLDKNVYNHHFKFDDSINDKNVSELLLKYYGNNNSENPMRINLNNSEFSSIFDVISNIPEDNMLRHLINVSTEVAVDIPLMDIINGNYSLLLNDYLKVVSGLGNEITIIIDKSLLGLESDLTLKVAVNETKIDYIKIVDLKFGSKVINLTASLNNFSDQFEANRLKFTEPKNKVTYIDGNYLDLFLKIGINTTQHSKFHLYGKFNLTFPGIAGIVGVNSIYSNIDFKIEIKENGKVNALITITLQDKYNNTYDITDSNYRETKFYILENDDVIVKQSRTEKGKTWLWERYNIVETFIATREETVNNLHYYLLKYTFGADFIFDQIDNSIQNPPSENTSPEDSPLNIVYENIFRSSTYDKPESSFNTTIDLGSIIDFSKVSTALAAGSINVTITHDATYCLSKLKVSGTPIKLLGSMDVNLDMEVKYDCDKGVDLSEYHEYVDYFKSYYLGQLGLGYFDYRAGNGQFHQTTTQVK